MALVNKVILAGRRKRQSGKLQNKKEHLQNKCRIKTVLKTW